MKECDLIKNFKEYLITNSVAENTITICDGNKSKLMDINFTFPITRDYISLEAKTFNDIRSNSNFFLSIFGKILKGRYLNSNNNNFKNKHVKYGFLFADDNKKQLGHYFNLIEKNDWMKFCEVFNVEYVFLCDNKSNVQQYQAKDFLDVAIKFQSDDWDSDDSEETDINNDINNKQ